MSISILILFLAALPARAPALLALGDEELARQSGAGIAFALDDFSFRMAPTSYIELTGTAPTAAAVAAGWRRGDARYYGLSMTNTGVGTDWYGNGCAAGAGAGAGLDCPLGTGGIANFASVYNPFMLRVFQYTGYDTQGNLLTAGTRPTILEFIGPSKSDTWRWAFWGELEVDRTGTPGLLQSQSIIHGKPSTTDGKPTYVQLMQTANSADRTLGIVYHSRLSGDFRFSANQTSGSPNTLHAVPDFSDREGLFFRNVDAFMPLGQLHYQAVTFNSTPAQDGNFTIELTKIPNVANVYNTFYCGATTCDLDLVGTDSALNPASHGYVRWGTFDSAIAGTSSTNGIYFSDIAGTIVNLGTSRLENFSIQHLKITTKGAGI